MSSIIYVPIDKFFGSLNDYKDLLKGDYHILVVSKDIISDVKLKDDFSSSTSYVSRYKNIDFLPSIFPSVAVMEFLYGGVDEHFAQAYSGQLKEKNSMEDLSCIVHMLIHDDTNIIIVMSNAEYLMGFTQVLQEFMFNMFKVKMYSYEDFMVEPEVITDIGNINDIKEMLNYHINDLNMKNTITGDFMNKLFTNMEEEYLKVLETKEIDDLVRLAAGMGVYVSKHKPKSVIIDHIMKSLVPKKGDE